MDCSPPGSCVHGILQARILKWVTMPSFRGSSNPGIKLESPGSLALQVDSLPLSHQGSPIKGLLFEIILSGPRFFLQVPCQNPSLQGCSRTSHLLVLFALCSLLWTNKRWCEEKITSTYFAHALAKQPGISYLTPPSLFFKIKKTT